MRYWILSGTLILLAAITFLSWKAVRGDKPDRDSTTLYGRVLLESSAGNVPVGGATLVIDERRTFTDARGYFAFHGVAQGGHTLQVVVGGESKQEVPVQATGKETRWPDIVLDD